MLRFLNCIVYFVAFISIEIMSCKKKEKENVNGFVVLITAYFLFPKNASGIVFPP